MPRESSIRYLAKGLLVALAYVIAGKLGLLLAIPPGYATAVWPPSGIALGALLLLGVRYWPAVWLGSFLTNLATALDSSGTAGLAQAVLPAVGIGVGATLQAVVGAVLIRRILGFPLEFGREREIFTFFALAGPVACLVNASLGVSVLYWAGQLPAAAVAYTWWTWWAGDAIGAVIFTPLVLMWFGGEQWRRRRLAVTLPLTATFIAAVLVFIYTSHLESARLEQRFHEDAMELASAIDRRLDLNQELLRAVGGLFTASDDVDQDEFRHFATVMLAGRQDLQAIEWAVRIDAAKRPEFERYLQRVQPTQPFIFERGGSGRLPALERPEYFPLRYAEPGDRNHNIRGFDMASESSRRLTLQSTRDGGVIAATPPLALVQGDGVADGFLMMLPVYGKALAANPTVSQRRDSLLGYAIAAIRAPRLVNLALGDRPVSHQLRLQIHDAATAQPLFLSPDAKGNAFQKKSMQRLGLQMRQPLKVADRTWMLDFTPTLDYLSAHNTLVAWMVLAAGLIFAAVVGAGALVITGRTAAVEAQVRERTAELAHTNERLAKADKVKSEFISTVSHELRTPLTSIRGSLGLLSSGAAGALPDKATPLVDIAYRNTARLALLIDDILDLEKFDSGKLSLDMQIHPLAELMEQAVEANRHYGLSRSVTFELNRPMPVAHVCVDANRFLQVMANLLSNAAKFSPEGVPVDLHVARVGASVRISVRDYGAGIPEAFRGRIFQRFSQADGSDSRGKGGTGLGLAISKALVERMQGTIGYDTVEGKGTTFFIELPLASPGPSV